MFMSCIPRESICEVWREGRNGGCILQALTVLLIRWRGRPASQAACSQGSEGYPLAAGQREGRWGPEI